MLSDYQQRLRDRFLAAPVVPAPPPWRPVFKGRMPVGGLQGIGFAVHPGNEHDLVMTVSMDGHGLFDAVTSEKIAPEWPNNRALLSTDGGTCKGQPGGSWWHVLHSDYSTFRAAGLSPSGRTLAVATSSDLTLWAREGNSDEHR